MKRIAVVITLVSVLALVLAACAPQPAATPCPPCPEGGECPECAPCEEAECPDCPAVECPECPEAGAITTDFGGREIVIAEDNLYPPFSYLDAETGEPIGFDYDFWREVCDRLNCTPVFVEAAWEGLFEAIAAGEYDMGEGGVTINVLRGQNMDYTLPFIEYGQVIMTLADDDRFPDEETLVASDATIGTQIATTNEATAIKLVGEDRVVSFETYDMPVVALLAGDVDVVIIDEVAGIGFINENPGQLKNAFSVSTGEMLAFPAPPLSEWTTPINYTMQQMFADGTMDEICVKWFLRPCTPAE
jgi:polar amino acid transport system substrate-binding protein